MTTSSLNRRYAIVGTGAVGGFYGIRLQDAGVDVHFLLRHDYEHVRAHGLRLDSVDGDIRLTHVNAYASAPDMPPCDVTLVCLKAYANDQLGEILPPLVQNGGTVVLMQNGLGAERRIAGVVPHAAILGGLCFLCSNRIGPGTIRHLDYGRVTLGAYAGGDSPAGVTPAMQAVAHDLGSAGIDVTLADDLLMARWKKLVWNIPFNGLSVICDADTHAIVNSPPAHKRVLDIMQEIQAVAAAYGREIPDGFLAKMITDTEKMAPYKPSMKLDREAGRPLELEAIYGEPIRAAQRVNVPMPETQRLYEELRAAARGGRTDA